MNGNITCRATLKLTASSIITCAVLIFSMPVHSLPIAYSEAYISFDPAGVTAEPVMDYQIEQADTGSVTSSLNTTDTTDRTAKATATTGSVGKAGTLAEVSISPQLGPGDYNDIHEAAAYADYQTPWIVESTDPSLYDVGDIISNVKINLRVHGELRLAFDTYQQRNCDWAPASSEFVLDRCALKMGDPINGENQDADAQYFSEVGVDMSMFLDGDGIYDFDATLNTDSNALLLNSSGTSPQFTDMSFLGDWVESRTWPGEYSYFVNDIISINLGDLMVGQQFELGLHMSSNALFEGLRCFTGEYDPCPTYFDFTATSDFFNTVSYDFVDIQGIQFAAQGGEPPVTSVPEPSTLLLITAGVAGLGFASRTKSRFRGHVNDSHPAKPTKKSIVRSAKSVEMVSIQKYLQTAVTSTGSSHVCTIVCNSTAR